MKKLPDWYQGRPYALDVLPTQSGQSKIVEMNPGWSSGFLRRSSGVFLNRMALHKALTGRYPKEFSQLASGAVGVGGAGLSAGLLAKKTKSQREE